MKKIILFSASTILVIACVYGLLQIDWVSRHITPKRYWKKQIMHLARELGKANKMGLIKEIQLKKKVLTGELDVAQDVILGIDRGISISTVQTEIDQLKDSVMDSQKAVETLRLQLTEAKEKFNSK